MTLTRVHFTPRERELADTCFHEAGHAVAAMVLGGTLRSSVVSGGLRHGTIDGLITVEMPPRPRAGVGLCQGLAQACWRHGRRPSQREVYAVLDTTGRCRLGAAGRRWRGPGYSHHTVVGAMLDVDL